MNSFSNYSDFRSNIPDLKYAKDIYVEIRTINSLDKIVGFLSINDNAQSSSEIISTKNNCWNNEKYQLLTLELLNTIAPAYMVYTDRMLSMFHLHSYPFNENNYTNMNESEFKDFIEGMGNIQLSGRQANPPRYPSALPPYSRWHYKLDWSCKCRDIDYFEIRPINSSQNEKIVAMLEVTGNLQNERHIKNSIDRSHPNCIFNRLSLHQTIFKQIRNTANLEVYFVVHDIALSIFYIFDINYNLIHKLNRSDYINWLKYLK